MVPTLLEPPWLVVARKLPLPPSTSRHVGWVPLVADGKNSYNVCKASSALPGPAAATQTTAAESKVVALLLRTRSALLIACASRAFEGGLELPSCQASRFLISCQLKQIPCPGGVAEV